MTTDRFEHQTYQVRKKFFKIFGGAFHIYDPTGQVAFYSRLKAFKLKEDIRVYTGEDMQTEALAIRARQLLDIAATYDVVDSATNEKVGALRRKALKSMVKDEWVLLDSADREIGLIKEDSVMLALARRLLTNLIPQKFIGEINGIQVFTMKQRFNPLILKIDIDFSPGVGRQPDAGWQSDSGGQSDSGWRSDSEQRLDKRLGIAAAVLLCAIEGRQR